MRSTAETTGAIRAVPMAARLVGAADTGRHGLEQFIRDIFHSHYGARVRNCMPQLLELAAIDGRLLAALGLRPAGSETLFLETYLEQAVEHQLGAALAPLGINVRREQIMEVGNLAASHAGGARWLIIALTAYLQGAGYDWVVFTALPGLRNSFRKLGLHMIPLGPARLERLPARQQSDWGRYYDGGPEVVAVNVHHTYGVLDRHLRMERTAQALHTLWRAAYSLGTAGLHDARPIWRDSAMAQAGAAA